MSEIAEVEVFFTTARYPETTWLRPRGYVYGQFPPGYSLPGVSMQAFDYPALPLVSRPLNGWVSAAKMHGRIRKFNPDVVLGYWIYPEGYGALQVAKRLGKPCVIGARGSDIRVRDRISKYFTQRALRGASQVITVSDELRVQAIERYGAEASRVSTIVNGCNTALFHPRDPVALRRELALPAEAELITYVGRMVEAKGVRELVEAFASVAGQRPRAHLVMVGDGVFMDSVKASIAQLNLVDRVTLPGAVQPADVARWIGASDLLCLPSYSEGYPNVLVEALASGVPVVATDVGGAREIVDAASGVLIAPRDVPGLAAALVQVLEAPFDRATLSGRFGRSWADVARDTLAVCQRAATMA